MTNGNFNFECYGKYKNIMTSKKWMNEKENILLQSFGGDNRTDYDWALETSSIIIRDTEFHPV